MPTYVMGLLLVLYTASDEVYGSFDRCKSFKSFFLSLHSFYLAALIHIRVYVHLCVSVDIYFLFYMLSTRMFKITLID